MLALFLVNIAWAHQTSGTTDKVAEYKVLSDSPNVQVEVNKDAVFLKKIRTNQFHAKVVVELPAGVTSVDVNGLLLPSSTSSSLNTNVNLNERTTAESFADKTVVTISDNDHYKDIEIFYALPGPKKQERIVMVDDAKEIFISSKIHFTDILARTKIRPLPQELVVLTNVQGTERVPVEITNYIDADMDGLIEEIEWIVPQLSNQTYQIELQTTFNNVRADNPNLPSGWYIQGDGQSDVDDGCIVESAGSWVVTNNTFSGNKGVTYTPTLDTIGCGIKLPGFLPGTTGVMNITFNFKTDFTVPESHMEILNYGFDNCDVKFNAAGVVEQVDCAAAVSDLGDGWKQISITDWHISDANEPVLLFITPPFLLWQIGETATMTFDDVRITLP